MVHIVDYYDDEAEDISIKKLKQFKTNMFVFFDKQINTNCNYTQIKTLWNLSVAELRSESIVESICSILKKIYTLDRSRVEKITLETLLQLRLSLPLSKKQRDTVIKKVIARYHELYPHQITHKISKVQRQRRQNQGLSTSTTIHKWQQQINTAFTVPFE